MKILSVASEIYPLVKTGGLGDVTGTLPVALSEHGVETVTLVPGYPAVMAALTRAKEVMALDDLFGGAARVLRARVGSLDLLVIDAPHLFDRPGNPYIGPDGKDWPDNAFRFGALSWVASRIGLGEVASFMPDIVHCHDWQAGLAPAYLSLAGARVASVITIHNLAYQGKFPTELLSALRLPPESYSVDGVEYYGTIGFMKAGLHFADYITTVSPTYADEIQMAENGRGLDGLLRHRAGALTGIVNGIDTKIWNPQRDKHIASRFGPKSLAKRAANTVELRNRFGLLAERDRLLIGVVSRLVWQKGLDILADAAPALLSSGAQFAILGTGDAEIEGRLSVLASAHPGNIGFIEGYDEDLAHLMHAGADVLFVPSRFEPCGMTQLCAMHYGAVPIVAKVGGLSDTVVDSEDTDKSTGFHISPVTREAVEIAFTRAAAAWAHKTQWRKLQQNGMAMDVSWNKPAEQYARLYSNLLATKD
jgi:starch synthase